MYKRPSRATWVVLAAISGLVFLVALIVVIALSGNNDEPKSTEKTTESSTETQVSVLDIAQESAMRLTKRGAIAAEATHLSYQITVSPSATNMTLYQGYLGKKLREANYANNMTSYKEFAYGLEQLQAFKDEPTEQKLTGICPNGSLIKIEILHKNKVKKALFATSCVGTKDSFKGDMDPVLTMFQRQVPEYRTVVRGLVI
jgi:hypothetical protein